MKPFVVDASAVGAAVFQEEYCDAASLALTSGRDLRAPDLIYVELANVILKRRRRGQVDDEQAGHLLDDILDLPLLISPSISLVEAALRLALRTGRSAYDCLYLAMAIQADTVMLTCDQRLANALAGTLLEKHVKWLGAL
jgi:predicted nucleic acid-binding protein